MYVAFGGLNENIFQHPAEFEHYLMITQGQTELD